MEHAKKIVDQKVADAVVKGLSARRKNLPSWLFYDEEGDRIFSQIMRMPEYYPTRCEYDILQLYKTELVESFQAGARQFRLVELGAGDGLKTEILLRHFVSEGAKFTYSPIDISANVLRLLSHRLTSTLPALKIEPQHKSYDEALADLHKSEETKVVLFMGANIGNFTVEGAAEFLEKLARSLRSDDLVLVGFDLKKDPRVILEAYDDPRGLTAEFNLNLLRRLNGEIGADFEPQNFQHYASYDPQTGETKSFLISLRDQEVHMDALNETFRFNAWEPIQTEVSQKYDFTMIGQLMTRSGFLIQKTFCDPQNYFSDVLVRRQ